MLNDINEDLGGGSPSFKFAAIGDTVKGKVIGGEKRQDTDLQGTPKTWDDGSPMLQLVVTLQTDERSNEIEDDDGRRRIYIKFNMKSRSPTPSFRLSNHQI